MPKYTKSGLCILMAVISCERWDRILGLIASNDAEFDASTEVDIAFDVRYRSRYCILMVGGCRRVRSLKVRVFSSLGVVFTPYPLTTTIGYPAPYSYPPLTTLLYLSPCLHSSRLRPVRPNARPIVFSFSRWRRPI